MSAQSHLLRGRILAIIEVVKRLGRRGFGPLKLIANRRVACRAFVALVAVDVVSGGQVQAQTASAAAERSTLSQEKVTGSKLRENVENIDKEVTAKYIRVQSGSRKRLSLTAEMVYSGGSIEQPFGSSRPQISEDPSFDPRTSFFTNLGARVRLTQNDSLSLGTGLRLYTPLQGDMDPDRDQLDVTSPYVNYSRVYRFAFLQNISTVGVVFPTQDRQREADMLTSVTISQNTLTQLGRWRLGAIAGVTQFFYGTDQAPVVIDRGPFMPPLQMDTRQFLMSYMLIASPYFEYGFTEKWAARSMVSVFNYMQFKGTENNALYNGRGIGSMQRNQSWATLGAAYYATRDFFVYPNILFDPENPSVELSQAGLTLTANL